MAASQTKGRTVIEARRKAAQQVAAQPVDHSESLQPRPFAVACEATAALSRNKKRPSRKGKGTRKHAIEAKG